MTWLRRIGRAPTIEAPTPAEPEPAPIEGAAPGIAALLSSVSADRSHSVVDLGPATAQSLDVYSRYARWVRFADVLGEGWRRSVRGSAAGMLEVVGPHPVRPYDLVFAWDFLDRLFPKDRASLAEWMADVTAPRAHLHLVVRASEQVPVQPVRFTILETDRIRCETMSPIRLPPAHLLPADVAKVLAPMRIVHAFTLKTGFREYVAVRR